MLQRQPFLLPEIMSTGCLGGGNKGCMEVVWCHGLCWGSDSAANVSTTWQGQRGQDVYLPLFSGASGFWESHHQLALGGLAGVESDSMSIWIVQVQYVDDCSFRLLPHLKGWERMGWWLYEWCGSCRPCKEWIIRVQFMDGFSFWFRQIEGQDGVEGGWGSVVLWSSIGVVIPSIQSTIW